MKKDTIIPVLILFIFVLLTIPITIISISSTSRNTQYIENFSTKIQTTDGLSFGPDNFLTFELFRAGQFIIDGESGYAHQISPSYLDSAIIRSTNPLPNTYTISVVVGDIDYGLKQIQNLKRDDQYHEGPTGENGCYFIAITDQAPTDHYTNDWWHQHRKVVIDTDNNIWGHGMPDPIFMVYFDKLNQLMSFDEKTASWTKEWRSATNYKENQWYIIELQKTSTEYIWRIKNETGQLLAKASVTQNLVWQSDPGIPDYFVIGEPHENYYQGSFKIKSITIKQ